MNSTQTARRPNRRLAIATTFVATLVATTVFACNVPVFRYALEHWNPDAYRGVLFHRGPLPESVQKNLAKYLPGRPDIPANISIRTVDLQAEPEAADRDLAATLKDTSLPQLVVRYPARHQIDSVLWQGPVEGADFDVLVNSPARQEVLKRLVSGQTAVWLLIASGDAAQDDTAELTLEEELMKLKTNLKLPERTDAPEDAIGDGPELRVEFSTLRVTRNDPKETALVSMLMNSEADLAELNEPLVFPVFGRGRSLLPLVGPGITPENIRGSARFLAGACSCQVKEQNPGFDLLVAANWNELIPWAKSPVSTGDRLPKPPELLPIAPGTAAKPAPAVSPQVASAAAKPAPIVETPSVTETPVVDASSTSSPAPAATAPVAAAPQSRMPLGVGAIALMLLVIGFLVTRR
jgi:hypothetical protein